MSKGTPAVVSYKISVKAEDLEKALKPTVWPLRVKMREFILYSSWDIVKYPTSINPLRPVSIQVQLNLSRSSTRHKNLSVQSHFTINVKLDTIYLYNTLLSMSNWTWFICTILYYQCQTGHNLSVKYFTINFKQDTIYL